MAGLAMLVPCTSVQPWRVAYQLQIPVYSFAKHQRLEHTTSIYSPHVLILEGIFALYDPRVLKLLDIGVCCSIGGPEGPFRF